MNKLNSNDSAFQGVNEDVIRNLKQIESYEIDEVQFECIQFDDNVFCVYYDIKGIDHTDKEAEYNEAILIIAETEENAVDVFKEIMESNFNL